MSATTTATAEPAHSTPSGAAAPLPHVTIRPARSGDLLAIAHLWAAAFMDDSLVGETVHPHRAEYPHDVYLGSLWSLRPKYWDYRCVLDIAVISAQQVDKYVDRHCAGVVRAGNDVPDVLSREDREAVNDVAKVTTGSGDVVVGLAQWTRYGDGEGVRKRLPGWWDPRNLMLPLTTKAMALHERIWPNRASDPAQRDIFSRSLPHWIHLFADPARAECWNLATCAVHPCFQGQGIGRKLVAVGKARADAERVCAVLTSSQGKDGFYQKGCGFEEQFGDMCAGEGNPMGILRGRGGLMYWYWPEGVKTPSTRETRAEGPSGDVPDEVQEEVAQGAPIIA
ncbi:uncharacterized protein B0I36DRAFT_339096 [Microdochium trichocladiopsis]|uniref:N-acetyltransferase domain-containing protein n=1 Tax=Microdochium trichocladiopsis TaxID=1682393 RepID=A0A9P9BIS1_9PEZI|nr:uncharacterized protein B0I36DRAFT_339096 [Microdochium trichocladiopsis]KAH7014658.1 hypothetical protein B0I36DRAFT_339096 [Microdochium trichocladiopsis]